MPNLPRKPFFKPYQPPTGFSGEATTFTVPSTGFCSSDTAELHPVAVLFEHDV